MRKLLLFLAIGCLFSACSPFEAVDNKRLLIKGNVVNADGHALDAIPVRVATTSRSIVSGLSPSNLETIHDSETGEDGEFYITSFDVEDGYLWIMFNSSVANQNYQYQNLLFYDEAKNRPNVLIDFETLELRREISLNINFNNTSGSQEEVNYSVSFYRPYVQVAVSDWSNLPTQEEIIAQQEVSSMSRNFTGSNEQRISVLEGTEAILNYTVGDAEPVNIAIPILNEAIFYEVNY